MAIPTSPSPGIAGVGLIWQSLKPLQFTSGTDTAANASAYKVTGGDWASGTITWDNKPAASTALATNISHNNLTGYTFSCKTAVQAWYNGSTTGSNANYGIMLRYYNESVADYNAVYSADCTTESKRPALTITYTPPSSSISVLEGKTYTLTAPSVSGTITWSSSNTSVATVNSSGKVTGVKAGKVTISASVSGTVQKTYTVYVRIPNGVYRIKNSSLGFYLGTYGSIAENTSAKLLAYTSDATAQLYQLWKVTHIGYGYYSIRPLYKLDMALHATSNSVDITNTGRTDSYSAVSSLNRWSIVYGTTGYNINHTGTSSMAMRPANGASSPGLGVITAANGSNAAMFNWSFSKVTNPPSGILLYDTTTEKTVGLVSKYVAASTTKTLAALNLAAYAYSGNAATTENITWRCTSGSSHLTVNQSTGKITALTPGTSLVTGSSSYGSIKLYITVTENATTDFVFIHQYDASFKDDPELVDFIDDAVNLVNSAYQKQFSISFSSSTDPYYRTHAITDQCPSEKNYESCHRENGCEGTCNTSHHKNLYCVSNQLYSSTIPQDHVVVFWTDRDLTSYCVDNQYVLKKYGSVYANVVQHRPVIHMMTIDDATDNRIACMAINLAHEFTHTLGMDDKYSDASHIEKDELCVMDGYSTVEKYQSFYQEVLYGDADLFCSSCEAEIEALLADAT